MITHREAEDKLRYAALYVSPEYRHTGYAMRMLSSAILRQKAAGIKYGYLDVNLAQVSLAWVRLIERHLVPLACQVTYKKQSWKKMD
jgi:GNAT superfamily N-acetyltransferase